MEFSGLIKPYPVGYTLLQSAFKFQLKQKQRLPILPHYQLSVIKMNSIYFETVDKWFAWKGMITMVAITVLIMINSTLGWGAVLWLLEAAGFLSSPLSPEILIVNGAGMAVVVACLNWGGVWLLRKEAFTYTHYPIRFNRKTRNVHVFRTDGTVLTVSWDSIFFTLVKMPPWNEWEVRGHVLEKDEITVKETFALSYVGTLEENAAATESNKPYPEDFVRAHWEFVRRYMEEGPGAVSDQVQFCMPVNDRYETIGVSVERTFANIAGAPYFLYWMLWPFCLIVSIFRIIAVRSSTIPQWPIDVERQCIIEADDPYAFEGNSAGDRVNLFPKAKDSKTEVNR